MNTVSHQVEKTSADRVWRRVENVSGRTGLDQIGSATVGERLAQIGDSEIWIRTDLFGAIWIQNG
jgi:hypothetical protein